MKRACRVLLGLVLIGAGTPAVAQDTSRTSTLGPPDYDPRRRSPEPPAVALGCGGTLTLRFTDNVLHDVPGPDLYVFEVGPAIEPMKLAISPDGAAWTDMDAVGAIGSELQLSFDAAVLFDFNRSELRGRTIGVEGFGASRPVAPNATDDGRQQNRRVEILVTPRAEP